MKYVKYMTLLLTITTVLAASGVFANSVAIVNLTIPNFSNPVTTGNHNKDNFGVQSAIKTGCTDNLSGNEMAIQTRVYSVNYGYYGSWYNLPKGTDVTITSSDGALASPGTFRLNLRAKNSFITTGNFNGAWNLN